MNNDNNTNLGLVNPMQWMEVLIALSVDQQELVREQAESLLVKVNESNHGMVIQMANNGILAAFNFTLKTDAVGQGNDK